jgi:hypothetical protein
VSALKETELYQPVKELLASLGYDVKAEVAHIDVVAVKDEEWIAVELKTSFTLKLILQATERQKLSEKVYVAISAPTGRQRFSKAFKEYEHLLKRLELGLIFVYLKEAPTAQIIFPSKEYPRSQILSRNRKKSKAVLSEAKGRHADFNVGGSNGKLMTVYREKALLAASYLSEFDDAPVKTLRELTGNETIQRLLHANHYGWFEKAGHGVYKLSAAGKEALITYSEAVKSLKREINTDHV